MLKTIVPVVEMMDNAIHLINHYLVDKCGRNKLLASV